MGWSEQHRAQIPSPPLLCLLAVLESDLADALSGVEKALYFSTLNPHPHSILLFFFIPSLPLYLFPSLYYSSLCLLLSLLLSLHLGSSLF